VIVLREVVKSGWFARFDLLLVIASGVVWSLWPDYVGASPLLLLMLPWALRMLAKEFPFQRTRFDWLIVIFLITAWVGYWASFNESEALTKAWLITTSVFLYFALSAQPEENLVWITSGLFLIGVGVSVYFFLTHDFVQGPRKIEAFSWIGALWAAVRPQLSWAPIHPNYVSGTAALTAIFGLYPLQKSSQGSFVRASILTGFFVVLSAIIMATSRGVWMALASAAGIWLLWRLARANGILSRLGTEAFFPILVLICLFIVVVFLYVGPANSASSIPGSPDYGIGSRAELFARGLYFVGDYPITGAGLESFPGLYSQYMLGIPYFYVLNSHNLFLDVFIEQGVAGGLVFFLLYFGSIWLVSKALVRAETSEHRLFTELVLSALVIAVIHGMVDDYLYNGRGAILSMLLIGISMIAARRNISLHTVEGHSLTKMKPLSRQWYTFILLAACFVLAGFNLDALRAMWYANLGAVQLSKTELAGFPFTEWRQPSSIPQLDQADVSLRAALELDPDNRTAHHRLGLISMMRLDFSSAVDHLTAAYQKAPHHRGIIKALGFSHAWLGDSERAMSFLKDIPEAKDEFDSYYTYWKAQGRDDLSNKAYSMYKLFGSLSIQP